jgi:hypothetical protein
MTGPASSPATSCCGSKAAVVSPPAPRACCGSTGQAIPIVAPPPAAPLVAWKFWNDAARFQRFLTTTTGWFLVRWLAVAYAIESLMIAWLPVGAVGTWLGAGAGPFAVPLAVGIGIPIYLNSFAAIPFVSGLIGLGMSPATGLAWRRAQPAFPQWSLLGLGETPCLCHLYRLRHHRRAHRRMLIRLHSRSISDRSLGNRDDCWLCTIIRTII